jgi:hypothetical protein
VTEWPEQLREQGLRSAEEANELASRWEPAAYSADYPFPIRSDTGLRDLRMREPVVTVTRTRKHSDMTLGDRPEERGARADEIGPGVVLDVACRTCGHPAGYEVRNADRSEGACPLHLFSIIAAYLLGSNVVAVSLINKRAKYAERREMIEEADHLNELAMQYRKLHPDYEPTGAELTEWEREGQA